MAINCSHDHVECFTRGGKVHLKLSAGFGKFKHIFEKGAHGVGLANDDPALNEWSKVLANWLRVRGIIK